MILIGGALYNFVDWSSRIHLLNLLKTLLTLGGGKPAHQSVRILDEEVGVVNSYKYVDVHLDSRLDWRINTYAVYRKRMSRLLPEEAQII